MSLPKAHTSSCKRKVYIVLQTAMDGEGLFILNVMVIIFLIFVFFFLTLVNSTIRKTSSDMVGEKSIRITCHI